MNLQFSEKCLDNEKKGKNNNSKLRNIISISGPNNVKAFGCKKYINGKT